MTELQGNTAARSGWRIALGCTLMFGLIGFAIGWSIETQHPDDRLADILIPTFAFLTAGFLVGYVIALVIYRRFQWFDAVLSFSIPPLLFVSFIMAKSGDWATARLFGFAAAAILLLLVARFVLRHR